MKCKIKMPHDFPDSPCKKCNAINKKQSLLTWKVNHYAITGETFLDTIQRIKGGKTKFGKILRRVYKDLS